MLINIENRDEKIPAIYHIVEGFNKKRKKEI